MGWAAGGAWADASPDPYQLNVKVEREDREFHVTASFHSPLTTCEAYRFLTDYDAVKRITGVVDSKATRVGEHLVKVERWTEERVLLFTVKMHAIIHYTEVPYVGLDFEQQEGDAKSYSGHWRLSPDADGSVFRYDGRFEPDSSLPVAMLVPVFSSKTRSRFAEMARNGAQRKGLAVAACG